MGNVLFAEVSDAYGCRFSPLLAAFNGFVRSPVAPEVQDVEPGVGPHGETGLRPMKSVSGQQWSHTRVKL